ncbi:hypothetical protein RvY_02999 [Ramazzottius varieornatus]|uniref:Uncharacterized protein n=1 Tax=Ramazzottius varieornatus TaxID=947166 RepID=A0A1D1UW44_RAMVA|nr:hypothetical protein RvY_02999 [Ramazzottius varieornatus]
MDSVNPLTSSSTSGDEEQFHVLTLEHAPFAFDSLISRRDKLFVSLARLIVQLEELFVVVLQKLQDFQRIDGSQFGHV